MDELLNLPTESERMAVFREMEQLMAAEQAVIFLLHKEVNTAYNRNLRGIRFNSFGWVDFKDIWFIEDAESC